MSEREPNEQYPEKIEHVYRFDISPGQKKPQRLDAYITNSIEHATRSRVQKAIEEGSVTVNGEPARANYRTRPGDVIVVTVLKPPPLQLVPEDIPVPVVYEDVDIIVFNKPAGMPVHPGLGNRTGTLVNAMLWHAGVREPIEVLKRREDWSETDEEDVAISAVDELDSISESSFFTSSAVRPGIVHRLDKDTSGLIVIGKNYRATMKLCEQFAARTVKREYLALAWGVIKTDERLVESEIGRSTRDRKLMSVVARGGKYAATEVTVIERYDCATLIKCKLRTGRTHQIRVHLSHIKHPIVGDREYGGRELALNGVHHLFRKTAASALLVIHRQALHARTLGFTHPITGKELMFTSEIPDDIMAAITVLRPADAPALEL